MVVSVSCIELSFDLCLSGMVAARQMGFADRRQCPHLCKLASDYIRKAEGCEDNIYTFFADEPDADSLFIKLVEELERCTLSYFAFHSRWQEFSIHWWRS